METDESKPLVYSPNEARKLLKISRGLLYEAIRTGQIPSLRIGHRILIPRSRLERLLDEIGDTQLQGARDSIDES
jgi:excisionase family DNA binding protein